MISRGSWRIISRVLAQPWDFVLGVNCFIIGLALSVSLFFTDTPLLTSVQALPEVLDAAWSVGFFLGGSGLVLAVLWQGSDYVGRAIQRSALYLTGSSLMAYAVAIGFIYGLAGALPVALALSLSLGCGIKHHALKQVDGTQVTVPGKPSVL